MQKEQRTTKKEHKHPYYSVIGKLGGDAVKNKYANMTEEEIMKELNSEDNK